MNAFRADLHCHSNCSDGSLSPEELINHAIEIGLNGLSITDHDTVDAYKDAMNFAARHQFNLIPGVEFSASHKGHSVHILGYAFHLGHPSLISFCERHSIRRRDRNREIIGKLNKLEIKITEEDLFSVAKIPRSIGRPHIAQVMLAKGYVETAQEAFRRYLGEGKLAYAPGQLFSIEETLGVIHEAHGLAVIAHPHLINHQKVFRDLLEMNFDGIECFYSRFQQVQNERWVQIAQKKGWLMTGGSDFHGEIKPAVHLGCSWVDETTFQVLKDWMKGDVP